MRILLNFTLLLSGFSHFRKNLIILIQINFVCHPFVAHSFQLFNSCYHSIFGSQFMKLLYLATKTWKYKLHLWGRCEMIRFGISGVKVGGVVYFTVSFLACVKLLYLEISDIWNDMWLCDLSVCRLQLINKHRLNSVSNVQFCLWIKSDQLARVFFRWNFGHLHVKFRTFKNHSMIRPLCYAKWQIKY